MQSCRPLTASPFGIRRPVLFGAAIGVLQACQPKADVTKTESAVASPLPAPAAAPESPQLVVTEHGYGPLKVGLTFAAANDSLKGALKAANNANLAECDYVKWDGGPSGLRIMVLAGKIARIDVGDSSTIATDAGARVGDTEARIDSLYGARAAVTAHKYVDGHYLSVRSATPGDTLHFIIFETQDGKVTRYRAGAKPGVGYVEGCS